MALTGCHMSDPARTEFVDFLDMTPERATAIAQSLLTRTHAGVAGAIVVWYRPTRRQLVGPKVDGPTGLS